MSEAVLDASVVLKWFRSDQETNVAPARAIRSAFEAGVLAVTVPQLLFLEILNVAGRRWAWPREELFELVRALIAMAFEIGESPLVGIGDWMSRGLTAYDAAYVALAERLDIPLVTDDEQILRVAPDIAIALSAYQAPSAAPGR